MKKVEGKVKKSSITNWIMLMVWTIAFFLLLTEVTRNFVVGIFGWASCAVIPVCMIAQLLYTMGQRITVNKKRVVVYILLAVFVITTLHIMLASDLIASNDSYILAPLNGYGTVGGMIASIITTPILWICGSNTAVALSICFVITALLCLCAIYPLIVAIFAKKEEKPVKSVVKTNPTPTNLDKEELEPRLMVQDVNDTSNEQIASYEKVMQELLGEKLRAPKTKEPELKATLFADIKTEESVAREQQTESYNRLMGNDRAKQESFPNVFEGMSFQKSFDALMNTSSNNQKQPTMQFVEEPEEDLSKQQKIITELYQNAQQDAVAPSENPLHYFGRNIENAINNTPEQSSVSKASDAEKVDNSEKTWPYDTESRKDSEEELQIQATSLHEAIRSIDSSYSKEEHDAYASLFGGMLRKETPAASAPVVGESRYEAPIYSAPVVEEPRYEAPIYSAPVVEEPRYEAPIYSAPVVETPRYEAPVYSKPVVKEETASKAPVNHIVNTKRPYVAPPTALLDQLPDNAISFPENFSSMKIAIEEVLRQVNISGEVINAIKGPSFTRYEVCLGVGIAPNKVKQQESYFRMKLKTAHLNILAPIPDKDAVGFELKNDTSTPVGLRSVICSRDFSMMKKGTLPIPMGQTIEGKPHVANLASLPHLLVAGATGQGKSVFLNSLLMGLLYSCTPDEMRLLLIDPKRVETVSYKGLPHMLIRESVKEPQQAVLLLEWLVEEMDNRYKIFEDEGVRDIIDYNAMQVEKGNPIVPRLVLVVDEMSDLMMQSSGSVEGYIVRLAQLGRASGIHIVLATQRPVAKVITGLIKSNIANAVAFAVRSNQDSRIIIDEGGAENLLGKGDMLFGGDTPFVRLQGCLVTSREVKAVCDYIKENNDAEFDLALEERLRREPEEAITKAETAKSGSQTGGAISKEDWENDNEDMIRRVLSEFIISQRASISQAETECGLGYKRAKKIVNIMARRGYISYENNPQTRSRDIYYTLEEYDREIAEGRTDN
ncbi:MAG: DNA translocase FtsK [Bacillota bacterium]